jgi:uncharacterized membrane protein
MVAICLQLSLPDRHVLKPTFLFPAAEFALLIALLVGDPGRIDRRSPRLRRLTLILIGIMTADVLAGVIQLVRGILDNNPSETATVLLATGAMLSVTNIIAFSLWYWMLDRGGPAERAAGSDIAPAFGFAEMLSPEFMKDGWAPEYADYLYLAFTNAMAFSPTDTMPLTRWAKMMMLVQASIAIVVAVFVVARAVNVLN